MKEKSRSTEIKIVVDAKVVEILLKVHQLMILNHIVVAQLQ